MTAVGHKKQWEFLKSKFELNQLSHAYLFTGAKEIGKKNFAVELAKLVNCAAKSGESCQKCFSCQAIERGTFPDLLIVKSADSKSSVEDKKDNLEIDIGQIREVQNFLSYKSYYGGFKSVVIENAERMNIDAQDCFLKDLEEPKGRTLIVLISSKPDMLLPTITSRCQTIKFFKPKASEKNVFENAERLKREQEISQALLPVINSSLADKFKYVKSIDFTKQDVAEILEVMQKYFRNLLLADYGQKKIINILNLIENISNKLLFTNANPKLALEILLMET